jgi:hypothetical protein
VTSTRRVFLKALAGGSLFAPAGFAQAAPAPRIGRLIAEARVHTSVSQRIDFISRALRGVPYQADTLIGGPRRPEIFVIRDDAFDCVTFCEVVLAGAIATDLREFEAVLRRIRYDKGEVRWDRRNHYFAEWCQRSVENGICSRVGMSPSVPIDKTVIGELGKRRVSMVGIAPSTLMANRALLRTGDVIGFTSRQSALDYFHAGLVAFGAKNSLLLRHASQSHGRVLDEPMESFLAVNGVKYVTLLRAEESATATS